VKTPSPSATQIRAASTKLGPALAAYEEIQEKIWLVDVCQSAEFQRLFNRYYRVRRGPAWSVEFYSLMETSKTKQIAFPDALQSLQRRTGWIEASFASKLVATLNPRMPVIDKFVLGHFGFKLPRYGRPQRIAQTIEVYDQLCSGYAELAVCPTGQMILNQFNTCYPQAQITDLKKIDLVLWQVRSRNEA
jgi:hypothetical protein